MARLKPGVPYVYENADGVIYAREFGAPADQRLEIGRTFNNGSTLAQLEQDKLWDNIRRAAKTNSVLREVLDRAIIIYKLSEKSDG